MNGYIGHVRGFGASLRNRLIVIDEITSYNNIQGIYQEQEDEAAGRDDASKKACRISDRFACFAIRACLSLSLFTHVIVPEVVARVNGARTSCKHFDLMQCIKVKKKKRRRKQRHESEMSATTRGTGNI